MPVEAKSNPIPIRFAPSEAELVRQAAERDGLRASTWVRRVAERTAARKRARSPGNAVGE